MQNQFCDLGVNKGFIVYQAIAGKKTMDTARPGNNSGNLTLNGSEMEIGIKDK
jgi:hypothetical protein